MKKIYTSIVIMLLILTIYLSYTLNLKTNNINFIHLITNCFQENKVYSYKVDLLSMYLNRIKESKHFIKKEIQNEKEKALEVSNFAYNNEEKTIYIYSTHSDEEYSYSKNDVYNIVPNVKTASYILEDELKNLGLFSLVETENTIDIVNKEGLKYSDSYKVSRRLLESRKKENPSLVYFIDLHRDSVGKKATTITIGDTTYAKVMFLLGLENDNYKENQKLMEDMNEYLNKNYPGLSRGIYKKEGKGVNGIYNQDFNKNTFLIEVGGVENTIEEVANSLKVMASCIYNYINSGR